MGPGAELQLVARRAIAAGDEVTITYLDSSLPVVERRARLQGSYGFQCTCPLCVAQAAATAPRRPSDNAARST